MKEMKRQLYNIGVVLRLLFDLWAFALWVLLMRGWGEAAPRPAAWYLGLLAFFVYAFVLSALRRRGVLAWKTHPAEKAVTLVLIAALALRTVLQWF